jgi:hypothetical protein
VQAAAGGDLAPARLLAESLGGGGDVTGLDAGAALLLRGSLADLIGDHEAASRWFRKGADKGSNNNGPGADWREAASFLAVQAAEEAGDDEGARQAWSHWRQDHPNGRLASEAALRLAWLQLRHGETAAAAAGLAALAQAEPWLRGDENWRRTQATIDYLQGRPADALALLDPAPDDAAALYLVGLCEAAQGRPAAGGGSLPAGRGALPAFAVARCGPVRQGQYIPGRRRLAQRGRGFRRGGRARDPQ